MVPSRECPECRLRLSRELTKCPHCGRPSFFPNVEQALDEKAELQNRYTAALAESEARGARTRLEEFEILAQKSMAVVNRPLTAVLPLVDGTGIYSTFYQRRSAGTLIPQGDGWDRLREAVDVLFFGNIKEEIRFAALSADGRGLNAYGDCTLVIEERFIAHRASLFQTNTALYVERFGLPQKLTTAKPYPPGWLAVWNDRGKLCVAKLGSAIQPTSDVEEQCSLLLQPGSTTETDEFVEVHILGPLTIESFHSLNFAKPKSRKERLLLKAIREKLKKSKISASFEP